MEDIINWAAVPDKPFPMPLPDNALPGLGRDPEEERLGFLARLNSLGSLGSLFPSLQVLVFGHACCWVEDGHLEAQAASSLRAVKL